jgi:periplasmic divalent cation tolerance protein
MKSRDYCLIKTTCATKSEAKKIAQLLLEAKLAACIDISAITSLYSWENKIQEEQKFTLGIKTYSDYYFKIEQLILENHSYQIPQILQLPIIQGYEAYLKWVDDCLSS